MRRHCSEGGRTALLLFVCAALAAPTAGRAETLVATRLSDMAQVLRADLPRGAEACILWRHSVRGFEVADCYRNIDGALVLMHSHWADAAAGLDHIPGRGRMLSDGRGGYVIAEIHEAVPGNAYILRPGTMQVDHRLMLGETIVSLSAAAAQDRLRIALLPDQPPAPSALPTQP